MRGRASALDVAVFDRPGTYTVTLEQDVTNKRLRAKGAGVNVSFDLKGNEYVLDEISLGGLDGDNGRSRLGTRTHRWLSSFRL